MSDGIMLTIGDDGEATLYDDTYDIIIHCESKEEQDEARKALENIPHWIPVSERLPEEHEVVLTQAQFKDDVKMAVSSRVDFNYWTGWGTRDINVVAWMPLPEPWRGDADEID